MLSRTLLKMWFLPPLCNILLILVGLLLWRRCKRIAVVLILSSAFSLWLMATPIFANYALRLIETAEPLQWQQIKDLDNAAIVVLGAGHVEDMREYGSAQPDHNALVRVNYGVYLKRLSGLPLMLTGGKTQQMTLSHAEVMANYMAMHLRETPDWLEQQSRTTWENATYAADILFAQGIRRVVLVTQSVHMRRSELLFNAAGFEVIAAPTELSRSFNSVNAWLPTTEALNRTKMVMHEMLGLAWYSLNPPQRIKPSLDR